ncbi:MAG: SDR family oxidoreductase [Deltaproteobacteria bacterium]|nr:SDR family oxidoreductase [Deltaproteobacteria bacterium]
MRLENKRVLVVGASSGLGRESGLAIAREGARVGFAARRLERVEAAASEAGGACFALRCDVREEASCREVVAGAIERMGGLDALVYCPGISPFGPIEEIDQRAWLEVFSTNVIGFSLLMNAAIDELSANRGKVVVYSSISIDDSPPRPKQASYPISKIALERLIEAWQGEHRKVGFTSIANGDTLTEFGFGESMEKLIPIVQRWSELDYMYGRMMDVSSVAEQVVNALCSRETIRRIAITPHYPDVVETVDEMGQKAVETVRTGGKG